MTGYELGGRFHDDIGTVFKGPEQIRGGEGIINHEDEVMLVGDLHNGLDIDNVGFRESVLEQIEHSAVNIVGEDDIALLHTSAFMAYVTTATPKATAIQATLPSKAATLSSKVA